MEAENLEELGRRFTGPLTFGTAGLRGPLRAGPAGMNAAVATRAPARLGPRARRRSRLVAGRRRACGRWRGDRVRRPSAVRRVRPDLGGGADRRRVRGAGPAE